MTYTISKSQNWITISPSAGDITGETVTITVTINKTGLSTRIYKETITVSQIISPGESQDVIIDVYLNGFWLDSKYVNLVRIGTQIWMGENLNIGTRIDGNKVQTNNGIIEKYCYNDGDYNCDIYGGLYLWNEMMQYNPAEDTGNNNRYYTGYLPRWLAYTDRQRMGYFTRLLLGEERCWWKIKGKRNYSLGSTQYWRYKRKWFYWITRRYAMCLRIIRLDFGLLELWACGGHLITFRVIDRS